jgi:hypothetical protein
VVIYLGMSETYFRGGQIESVYIDMPGTGLAKFAPVTPARGSLFSARRRLGIGKEADRRRASRKKSCISGAGTEGRSAFGPAPHPPTSPAQSARVDGPCFRTASVVSPG